MEYKLTITSYALYYTLRTQIATRAFVEVVEIIENSNSFRVKSAKHVKRA